MNIIRITVGLVLVIGLLLGAGAMAVSAQGPTGTGGPSASQTPASAPPAAAINLDDPGRAATLGAAIQNIAPHSAVWFQFPYDNGGDFPRDTLTIRLVNGVNNGLSFEVWAPEQLQGNWWENTPVGKGTQEVVENCANPQTTTDVHGNEITTNKCDTNDLTWTGGFGASGTYYIRVINNSDQAVAPQLIIGGPGLVGCSTPAGPNMSQNQGAFYMTACQNEAASTQGQ